MVNKKLSEDELIDTEIRARESVRSEKTYVLRPRGISGVERRRLVAGLKKDLERLRHTKEYKARFRSRISSKLYAWGEWAASSGLSTAAGSTPLGNAVRRAEQNAVSSMIGYERGLSDYESLMITIDMCVSSLNCDDRDLLILSYQVVSNDAAKIWEGLYGKRAGRYRRRKSELLKIIADKING